MEIIQINLKDLTPYEKNAKLHPKKQIDQIKESITKFGMNDPIGVWGGNNLIVEGHGRFIACKELGFETVPCIRLDHLTEMERKEYTLIHNKTTMNSDFDLDTLLSELKDIQINDSSINMEDFDFSLPADDFVEIEEDEVPLPPKEAKTKIGDIYQLGNHRLLCGDSTKNEDVLKLMNGNKADMIFTDPPYNVNIENADGLKIQNDDMADSDFYDFLLKAFNNMFSSIKDGGVIYCFHADTEGLNFRQAFKEAGFKLSECLVWVKNSLVLSRQDYHWRHEPCLYGWKEGASHYFIDDRTQDTVWEYDKPKVNDLHPTMKPLELVGRAIKNSSKQKNIVLDLFGGSGSTLIACEQLNRACYTMELDPKYCDVIVERWENLTGKKAVLL